MTLDSAKLDAALAKMDAFRESDHPRERGDQFAPSGHESYRFGGGGGPGHPVKKRKAYEQGQRAGASGQSYSSAYSTAGPYGGPINEPSKERAIREALSRHHYEGYRAGSAVRRKRQENK